MDKDTEIRILQEEIRKLKSENIKLTNRIKELEVVEKLVLVQGEIIKDLQLEIQVLKVKKNSSNSSIPPSTDLTRKNKSLRVSSGKKPGGQIGHEGKTLEMTENPDKIIELIPEFCNICGKDLNDLKAEFESKRQSIEIVLKSIIIEYQQFSKLCPCGHKQMAKYPSGITNHIQYGPSVEAMVGYLSVYQYMPFKRLCEFFEHSFNGLSISEGSIDNLIKRLSNKALPFYYKIKEKVGKSKQVGGDETGAKVNGDKWWIWVWQTVSATFLSISPSRGKAVIEKLFPNGFKNAVLNSDRWRAHINTYAKGHQLCLAHLLRESIYLIELEKTNFAEQLKQLLMKAIGLKKECSEYARDNPLIVEVENEMNLLLSETLEKSKTPKTLCLQQSLLKYREYIFTFLYYAEVPPDNNGSERANRNAKVKLKVSGQFKTGQDAFCIIRSIIDTCKKNAGNVFETLSLIAQMPTAPAE